MQVIDFHTHVFPPEIIAARADYLARDRWFGLLYANPRSRMVDADHLIHAMDHAGIDASVIFGFGFADPGLCALCNAYVLDAARRYPNRLIPFVLTNPCKGEIATREVQCGLEQGALGIGELMPDGQGFELTDFAMLRPLMDLAHQSNVPVMAHVSELVGHSYPGKGTQGLAQAYRLAERYPENVLVLPHWGGGLPFYELMPTAREALRNVYYDTAASPYLYDAAVFRHVLAWAPDKVLYGTDYPLIGQTRVLRCAQEARLDEPILAQFLAGNARTILNWPRGTELKGA